MTLRTWLNSKQYPDLIFDLICLRCLIDSGIPAFLVAPVSGAKSTLINSLEKIYQNTEVITQRLERISPLRLVVIQDRISGKKAFFLSEDFSTIGDEEQTTYKTILLVSKLSYDKTYVDPLFTDKKHKDGLIMNVESLAFLCGMQPLWLHIYAQKEQFETIIQEKILRYYRLPIQTKGKHQNMKTVMKYLTTMELETPKKWKITDYMTRIMTNALRVQCSDRAQEYAPVILDALKRYIPEEIALDWIKQFALRFEFERVFLLKFYESILSAMPTVEVLHKQYQVLFHTLFKNAITYDELSYVCKIRGRSRKLTRQYIHTLVDMATGEGFVYPLRHKHEVRVYPTRKFQKYSIHIWRPKKTETDISGIPDIDNNEPEGVKR